MSEIKSYLGRLRRRLQANGGDPTDDYDVALLSDGDLDRLHEFILRIRGEPVVPPPIQYPSEADRRYYQAHPDRTPPREWMTRHEPEPLSGEEVMEMNRLLEACYCGPPLAPGTTHLDRLLEGSG